MRYLLGRSSMLVGTILLLVVGMLAYARRDAASDWVIFSVNQRHKNDLDIYRVLSDGTHTTRFAFTSDVYPSLSRIPENPGWLLMYDSDSGDRRIQLLHLLGHTKLEIRERSAWPSLYRYDRNEQVAYLTISEDFLSTRTIWQVDATTGKRTAFELPFTIDHIRHEFSDGGYIVWSDHASAGDLYAVRLANPPQVTRLTMGGKVLSDPTSIGSADWLYYLVDDDDPDPFNHLYRIHSNGTEEQLVADQVLNPPNAIRFWEGDPDTIYYWGGDADDPHLIAARPNGSQMTELPIPLIYGWVRGWSADHQWMYYTESSPSFAPSQFEGGNLRRVNLRTGENSYVWEPSNARQIFWSADHAWLILLTWEQTGYLSLSKMQPDGTDVTLLAEDIRSTYLVPLDGLEAVVFGTWGRVGEELHILDLQTLEIRPLREDAPPGRMRQILATLPMPESHWQAGWLVGMGLMLVGVGAALTRFSPIRQRA